jgi:acetylornithine deacetylase
MDQGLLSSISEAIESRREHVIAVARDLVRLPSVSGQEGPCALYCAKALSRLGLSVAVWEPDPTQLCSHAAYSETGSTYRGRPNVVAVLPGSGHGKSLILNAHTDVVPIGPRDLWHHDPWAADIVDRRLFGRGAADTKGGLAAILQALAVIQTLGIKLRGDLIVQCVVDEERGGNGTLATILRGYKADAAIVVEPWGLDKIMVGHRGSLAFRITVQGEAKSLGEKANSISAVEKMQVVVTALQRLRVQRKERHRDPRWAAYENPVPVLLGTVGGGDWFSSPPLRCTLEGVLGWLPGETLVSVEAEVRSTLRETCQDDPWLSTHPPILEFPTNRTQPCWVDNESPLVHVVQQSISAVRGVVPALTVANAGSDQWLYTVHGATPAVQMGPGGGGAHAPDEYVNIGDIVDCTKILALAAIAWCGSEEEL